MNNNEIMTRVLIGEILIDILEQQSIKKLDIGKGLQDCLDAHSSDVSNKNIIQLMKYNNLWPSTNVDGDRFDLVGVE